MSDQCEQGHEQSAKEELQNVLNSVYSRFCHNMVQKTMLLMKLKKSEYYV